MRSLTTGLRGDPGTFDWFDDGSLALQMTLGGRNALFKVDPKTGGHTELVGGARRISNFVFDKAKSKVAYIATVHDMPTELFVTDLKTGKETKLTDFNKEVNATIAWSPAERADTVTLLFDDRYRRRLRMLGDGGLDGLQGERIHDLERRGKDARGDDVRDGITGGVRRLEGGEQANAALAVEVADRAAQPVDRLLQLLDLGGTSFAFDVEFGKLVGGDEVDRPQPLAFADQPVVRGRLGTCIVDVVAFEPDLLR